MVTEVLNSLGLSIEESEIYSTLLDKGQLSASEISKNSKVKRTYVYAVCKSLIKKGLIQQLTEKNITKFAPLSPDHLMDLAERQKQEALKASQTLEGILPTLKQKYSSVEVKPVVTYFEGYEGIKKVYMDTIKEGKTIYAFLQNSDIDPEFRIWLREGYAKKRAEQKIKAKVILASGDYAKEYSKTGSELNREVKIIPASKYPFQVEVNIYGNKIAYMNFHSKANPIGIIIENEYIAKTMLAFFNLTWDSIKS